LCYGDRPNPPAKKGHSSPLQLSALHSACLRIIRGPIGWIVQDATWCGGRLGQGMHIVLVWRPSSSPPNGAPHAAPSHFSVIVAKPVDGSRFKMPYREVGFGPGDIVLDLPGRSTPHGKGNSSPHFSAHVYCGQTVAHLSRC